MLDLGTAADRRLSLLRSPPTRRDSPSAVPLTPHDAQEMIEAELEKYQQVFTKLKVGTYSHDQRGGTHHCLRVNDYYISLPVCVFISLCYVQNNV